MKLSVIVPVYNEEATITAIIDKVLAVNLPTGVSREIVIVNDGSKDKTAALLIPYQGRADFTVIHQQNQGKTGALLTGLKNAKGDIFLVQDADLEYDPACYPRLLEPILKGQTQVVYGSRFMGTIEGMEFINRAANTISNWTVNILFHQKITDINTCYKVFTRKAFEGIIITGSGFEMDTELTIKFFKKGLSIQEIPIPYTARSRQAGKKIKWSTALAMYWQIIKYRFCR